MVAILGANSVSGGYEVSNSLRFNDGDSPQLMRNSSGGADGNEKIWTWSGWVKRSTLGTQQAIFTNGENNSGEGKMFFDTDDKLAINNDGQNGSNNKTSRVFRDVSSWYHIVWAVDVTQSSNDDRWKLYINGELISASEYGTPTINNADGYIQRYSIMDVGIGVRARFQQSGNSAMYFDGYIAEVNFIDGQQKAPTDFGEFDNNGVWIPKAYDGTYGTNGFYLQFEQTGTGTDASGIGADTSGNDNHFAVTNLAATDVTEDTCTNNFATLNSIWRNASAHSNTYSEGNLKINLNSSGGNTYSTIAVSQGKWYFEFETLSNFQCQFEGRTTDNFADYSAGAGNTTFTWYYSGNIKVNNSDSGVSQAYGHQSNNTNETKEICGVAVDLDNNKVYFHRQGTYVNSGNPSTGSNGITITNAEYMFGFSNDSGTTRNVANFNFGNPAFAISSGNTDGKYGNFEYAVPSGYYALCTKRLAEFG